MKLEEIEKIKEKFASLEHERWSNWMKYVFGRGHVTPEGNFQINKSDYEWWKIESETDYFSLNERQKDSDRKEVKKYLEFYNELFSEVKKLQKELLDEQSGNYWGAKQIEELKAEVKQLSDAFNEQVEMRNKVTLIKFELEAEVKRLREERHLCPNCLQMLEPDGSCLTCRMAEEVKRLKRPKPQTIGVLKEIEESWKQIEKELGVGNAICMQIGDGVWMDIQWLISEVKRLREGIERHRDWLDPGPKEDEELYKLLEK